MFTRTIALDPPTSTPHSQFVARLTFALDALAVAGLGVLIRRNSIVIFMSVELMLNAANLAFVAFARAYEAIGKIQFEGMTYRRDIGARALARLHGPRQA